MGHDAAERVELPAQSVPTPGPVPTGSTISKAQRTYWERAKSKLEEDNPELSEKIKKFLDGKQTSEEVVNNMKNLIQKHNHKMQTRLSSLPHEAGSATNGTKVIIERVKPALKRVMKCALAFKDCGNVVAALDPHGIAPIVWAGTTTLLQVRCPHVLTHANHLLPENLTSSLVCS